MLNGLGQGVAGRGTQLFRQDITALNLPFRYCAAFIAGGSFQLLTGRHAAIDALLRVHDHGCWTTVPPPIYLRSC